VSNGREERQGAERGRRKSNVREEGIRGVNERGRNGIEGRRREEEMGEEGEKEGEERKRGGEE